MSPDVANEETAPTVEGFRRHSYQRPDPETASPPVQDNTSANQQQQRRRSSVRRRRNSQHRRSSFIMTRIRQALSIDYEPAGVNEEEEFSEEQEEDPLRLTEESLSTTHNSPRYGRYLIGLLGVLGVLVVAPLASKDRRHNANTKNPTVKDNNNNHPPINTIPPDTCDTNPNLITQRYQNNASKVGLPHGAVAADHALCSSLGTRILQAGGTAADAAVTTALCLGVANPASSGLGGGGFILVHGDAKGNPTVPDPPAFRDARTSNVTADSGKITEVIDCRETAPAAATTRMFVDNDNPWASTYGGLAAAVPGECVGLELLHARHGALSWQTVVQPVVELARSGVEINTNLAFEIALTAESYDPKDPGYGLRALLTHQDDWQRPLLQGELFKNEKLADTLQAIMDQGCRALYQGERAKGLAKDVQKAGGVMTAQDIASYVPTLRSPVVAHDIQGFSIAGVPPPSSGGAAIVAIARFLAGYASPFASFADTLSMHRFVEGCRHVFALRMSLSDPDYNTETVQQVVRDMVEGTYIDGLRNITRDDTTLPLSQYGGSKWAQLNDTDGTGDAQDAKEGDRRGRRKRSRGRRLWREFGYLEDHGTSHFSIVDGQGNAVAMTTSVNMYFGSQVVSESTGVSIEHWKRWTCWRDASWLNLALFCFTDYHQQSDG